MIEFWLTDQGTRGRGCVPSGNLLDGESQAALERSIPSYGSTEIPTASPTQISAGKRLDARAAGVNERAVNVEQYELHHAPES